MDSSLASTRGSEMKFHSNRNPGEIQILSVMFRNSYNTPELLKLTKCIVNTEISLLKKADFQELGPRAAQPYSYHLL